MEDIDKSWLNIFTEYNEKYPDNTLDKILDNLSTLRETFAKTNTEIYPKTEYIFKCFKYFDLENTKVIIIGQDPYHGPNQATGLAFGCNIKPPPSLRNIENELKNDIYVSITDYTLEKWAKQGVLLLNTSLTVVQSKPGTHITLWQNFTQFIIDKLINSEKPLIFIAWGAYAHGKLLKLDNKKHHLHVSSHPSPLSVMKKYKEFPAFYYSKPFSQINSLLPNKQKIIW